MKGLRTEQRASTRPGNQKILSRKLLSKDSPGPRGEPRKEAGGSEVPSRCHGGWDSVLGEKTWVVGAWKAKSAGFAVRGRDITNNWI